MHAVHLVARIPACMGSISNTLLRESIRIYSNVSHPHHPYKLLQIPILDLHVTAMHADDVYRSVYIAREGASSAKRTRDEAVQFFPGARFCARLYAAGN